MNYILNYSYELTEKNTVRLNTFYKVRKVIYQKRAGVSSFSESEEHHLHLFGFIGDRLLGVVLF